MSAQARLRELFKQEFKLCAVGRGQTVAVLSEGDTLRHYAETSLDAASELGAKVVDVNIGSSGSLSMDERMSNIGRNSLSDNPEAMQACLDADLVIDHMLLLFSKEQLRMQKAGSRILLVVEPEEILDRLLPSEDLRKRVERSEQRLKEAKILRFANDAGTDVTYHLGQYEVGTEYGYTDIPGRWDHWPGGFLATLASRGGVTGRVVMDRGDILLPQKIALEDPIEFTIRNGRVVEIAGGTQAKELRTYIDAYEDPRAFAISHIGWGLNEKCIWGASQPGICMDARAYGGNVLFSLGPDTEFGGDNDTACHLDLPMRNCTLWLDSELILDHGELIPELSPRHP